MNEEALRLVCEGSPYTGEPLLLHMMLAIGSSPQKQITDVPLQALCQFTRCGESRVIEMMNVMQQDHTLYYRISVNGSQADVLYSLSLFSSERRPEEDLLVENASLVAEVKSLQLQLDRLEDIENTVSTLDAENKRIGEALARAEKSQRIFDEQQQGYVYIIRCGAYYKIGQTQDVSKRLLQFIPQLPEKAELIHTIPTFQPVRAERFFHEQYAEKRTNGEWFRLDDSDLIDIQSFTSWPLQDQRC